jgi:HD-like signal output (HDOD) protein
MKIEDVVSAATETFSLPDVCVNLRKALDDPNFSFDVLGEIISTDPLLSAKLLRLANSALFRRSQQIETVQKAVSVLGGEATYNLAMADAAGCAKACFKSSLLDTDKFWFDCLFRGALAKEIARMNRIRGSERYFVLGVLSRLSEMVISAHFPTQYENYLTNRNLTTPWQAQRQEFGFTIAQASSAICDVWGLPATIYQPVANMFNIPNGAVDKDVKILQLAVKLTFYYSRDEGFEELSSLEPESEFLQGDEESLHDMIDYCQKEAIRLQSFF